MKIFISVKTNAKQEKVDKMDECHFRVCVKAPPQEGKANEAVLKVLARYFDFPKSKFRILSGLQSRNKVVTFNE